MLMVRDLKDFLNQFQGSPVKSKNGLKKIKAAGIDTNSKAYKIVISDMINRTGNGIAYTNPQAIKNRMMNYDSEGNFIDPAIKYGAKSNGKIFFG